MMFKSFLSGVIATTCCIFAMLFFDVINEKFYSYLKDGVALAAGVATIIALAYAWWSLKYASASFKKLREPLIEARLQKLHDVSYERIALLSSFRIALHDAALKDIEQTQFSNLRSFNNFDSTINAYSLKDIVYITRSKNLCDTLSPDIGNTIDNHIKVSVIFYQSLAEALYIIDRKAGQLECKPDYWQTPLYDKHLGKLYDISNAVNQALIKLIDDTKKS